ncbi:MAG: substrate-binding domain-containing protein [Nodosilinea sp.]
MATRLFSLVLSLPLSPTRAVALLLATATVYPAIAERLLAQTAGQLPPSITVPTQLPTDTVLRVDGSSSMVIANEALRDRFLARFPNASVELGTSSTHEAVHALINGDLDIVAAGRPLTAAERSQGLIEVPIEREKIAIIISPQNPFDGILSLEQFARIFHGDIADWAEVGDGDGPIRVIDRPDFSDTRLALSRYPAFADAPFATGATADPVSDDDTDAVVDALGANGIGYAVASQVQGRSDVRVLAINQTLPEDPRYPYSQSQIYVYNVQNLTPAALAFLGLATTAPDPESDEAAAAAATPAPPAATPAPSSTSDSGAGLEPVVAAAETTPSGRFPWWLLAIPLLGGLLWWWLKNKRGPIALPAPAIADADRPSRIVLTPHNARRVYADWEIPDRVRAEARDRGGRDLMLRLFDVSDRDADRPSLTYIDQYPVSEDRQDLPLPIPQGDRDYQVELGYMTIENHWLPLAKSEPVRVLADPPERSYGSS